ncbi:MAG: chorismate mutase [Solirubrobacterales bacterium]|jgi:chorismate mutase-like protein|nr:chorismate mutase [Solirubrobacterales bacterium]
MTRNALRAVGAALTLAVVLIALPAQASAADRLAGARQVLALTQQRLSFMETVAASKWLSRSPIQDSAQEATVLQAARDAATARELAPASVANLFAAEITAAKVVQLGWGDEWLLYGFPADQPPPDLTAIRPQIAALTPAIADALTQTSLAHCVRDARARLLRDAATTIATAKVTPAVRESIVDAILRVRPVGRLAPCGRV